MSGEKKLWIEDYWKEITDPDSIYQEDIKTAAFIFRLLSPPCLHLVCGSTPLSTSRHRLNTTRSTPPRQFASAIAHKQMAFCFLPSGSDLLSLEIHSLRAGLLDQEYQK